MKKLLAAITAILFSTTLIGCQSMSNQDAGTLSGGVIGGLLGSQFGKGGGQILAIGAGTIAGAIIGGSIGKSMDEQDRMRMSRALENNSIGQPAYWTNEKTNANYTVVPVRNVTYDGNPYCREYRTTAVIAGKRQQLYGTACRQPDGTWQMQS